MKSSSKTTIGLMFLLVVGVLLFLLPQTKSNPDPEWWNDSWQYRVPKNISNSAGNLTDYTTAIKLDTESLISAGKMKSDCGDIRIVNESNDELDYWVENSSCNTNNTYIYVKIPFLENATNTTLYIYYGNSDADTTGNGTKVALLFDDWSAGSSSPWTLTGSHITEDRTTDYRVEWDDLYENVDEYLYKYFSDAPQNFTINFMVKITADINRADAVVMAVSDILDDANNFDNGIFVWLRESPANTYKIQLCKRESDSLTCNNTNYNYLNDDIWLTLTKYGNEVHLEAWSDSARSNKIVDTTLSVSLPTLHYFYSVTTANMGNAQGTDGWGDDYVMYEHIEPEPTVFIGSEEIKEGIISVNLVSPENGYYTSNYTINFKFNVLGSEIENCSLWTNESGNWQKTEDNQTAISNTTTNTITHTFSSDGTYLWNIQCWNSSGYVFNDNNWTVTIDTTPPQITVYNPQEGASYDMWDSVNKISGFTSFSLSFHSDDPINQSYYSLDSGENISFTNGTTLTFKEKANISSHTLTIWVQNNVGLWNSTTVSFNIVNTGAEIVADGYVYGFNVAGASITSGDFDNDSEMEFAIGTYGNKGALYVWDNDSINFIAYTDDSGGTDKDKWIWDIDAYDFDHDGILDIWVGTGGIATSYVRGYEWDGSSYQQIFVDTLNGAADAETIGFCDIDGDGDKELFANLYNSGGGGGVKMWWNVSDSGTRYDTARRLGRLQLCADIDNDTIDEVLYGIIQDSQQGNIHYLDWNETDETVNVKTLSNSPCSGYDIQAWESHQTYQDWDLDGEKEQRCYCSGNGKYYLLTFNDTWIFYDDITAYDKPLVAGHANNSVYASDVQAVRYINETDMPYLMDNLTTPDKYYLKAPTEWLTSTRKPQIWFVDGDYDNDGYKEVWEGEKISFSGMTDSDQELVYFRVLDLSPTDTTLPTLIFVSPTPTNGSVLSSQNYININVSANENLSTCFLDWYNGTWQNLTMTVVGTYCYKNMTNLTDGTYQYRVYANDTSDNWNVTETRTIKIDTTTPDISWNVPINNTVLNQTYIYWNATISEEPHTCLLNINGTTNYTMQYLHPLFGDYYCYYNLTNLTDGTYCGQIYVNDSAGNMNLSSSRCVTISTAPDTTPPSFSNWQQYPPDINSSTTGNLYINVTITDDSGVNTSSVRFYHWINDSQYPNQPWKFINGTAQDFIHEHIMTNITSSIFNITLHTYAYNPSVFNVDPEAMRSATKYNYSLDSNNKALKVRFYNISIHPNTTYILKSKLYRNSGDLVIYYCNNSYTNGKVYNSDYCIPITTLTSQENSTYQNTYFYGDENSHLNALKITSTGYIVFYAISGSDWEVEYANIDSNSVETTNNGGTSWSNQDFTPDVWLIQINGNGLTTVGYKVYACDIFGNCDNSSVQEDFYAIANLPPSPAPEIIVPENSTYSGTFNITWESSKDPNNDPFNYSLYLYYSNGTLADVLADNNIPEGTEYYTFDSTNYPDGQYYLIANATDDAGNTNFYILPYYFTISNVAPNIIILQPTNNSIVYNNWVLWNASISETPSSCILNINDTTNYTMNKTDNYCYYNLTGLTNQTTYCGKIYVNDTTGNMNVSDTVCISTLFINNTPPTINSVKLLITNLGGALNITLEINVTDPQGLLDRNVLWFGSTEINATNTNQTLILDIPDNLSQSGYIFINDSVNNTDSFLINFTITNNSYTQATGVTNNLTRQYIKKEDTLTSYSTNTITYQVTHYNKYSGTSLSGGSFTGSLTNNNVTLTSVWYGDWITESYTTNSWDDKVIVGSPLHGYYNFTLTNTINVLFDVLADYSNYINNTLWDIDPETEYLTFTPNEIKNSVVNITNTTVRETTWSIIKDELTNYKRYRYSSYLQVTENELTKNLPIYYSISTNRLSDYSSRESIMDIVKVDDTTTGVSKIDYSNNVTIIINITHGYSSLSEGLHPVSLTYYIQLPESTGTGGSGGGYYIPKDNVLKPPEITEYSVYFILEPDTQQLVVTRNNLLVLNKTIHTNDKIVLEPDIYTFCFSSPGYKSKCFTDKIDGDTTKKIVLAKIGAKEEGKVVEHPTGKKIAQKGIQKQTPPTPNLVYILIPIIIIILIYILIPK